MPSLQALPLFSSATRTSPATSAEFDAASSGGRFFINLTVGSGSDSPVAQFALQTQDSVSGAWAQVGLDPLATVGLLEGAQTKAVDFPPVLGSTFAVFQFPLVGKFRVALTLSGTSPSATFSMSVLLVD